MTDNPDTLEAAKAVLASRQPGRAPLHRKTTPRRPPLTVREAASRYKVSPASVQRAIKAMTNPLARARGRPMALTEDEDDALVAYVQWMERTGMPATVEQVGAVANTLRTRRNPNANPVSPRWLTGWRVNHPEIAGTYLKAVERARKSFEAQEPEEVELFYSQLQEIITKHRIGASEIWNEDEAGIRIGCLRERVQVLVVRTTRLKSMRSQVLDPANRESCTVVASINAVGDSLPPWLVFQHFPTTNWAGLDMMTGVRFARSPTGFSNAEIHLEWARHFNRWSWASSAQAKRAGKSLEEWFGCDEHLRLPNQGMSCVEAPPNTRPDDEKIYRLLVVDGFSGHTTLDFAEYCIKFDIIIAILPPHSTHIMQPLDVGVFQPLKSAHQKELRKSLAEGNIAFSRIDFLTAFKVIYEAGFTKHNIMAAFEKTGLFPVDATPTVTKILHEQLRRQQPINPAYASLLPSETRFQVAADTLNDIRQRYGSLLSSPTRENLRIASKVTAESVALAAHSQGIVTDKSSRIQAYANRKKRGKIVRPSGEFITSASMDDINREQEELLTRQTKQQRRQELTMHRNRVRGEMQKMREDYKVGKKQVIDGRVKTLNFKPWLEHTARDIEFYTLEQSHESLTQELKCPMQNSFRHDTSRGNDSAGAIKARAMTRPHPLQDMSSLPGSDDSVYFTGLDPSCDAEDGANDGFDPDSEDDHRNIPSSSPLRLSPSRPVVGSVADTPCPRLRARAYDRIMEHIKDFRDGRK